MSKLLKSIGYVLLSFIVVIVLMTCGEKDINAKLSNTTNTNVG